MGQADRVGRSGIQFFGEMTASISHDLKNVLAVINENAGLLEDLCLMAEKGRPLDLARLKRISGDVQHQVRRGNQLITHMNKFAHTTDSESLAIDLRELLELLATLSVRSASMRGVSLEVSRSSAPVTVTTFPFGLLNLLWLCLNYAMAAAGPENTVELSTEKTTDGAWVRFRKIDRMEALPVAFPSDPEKTLGRALNAHITADAGSREIAVSLPNKPTKIGGSGFAATLRKGGRAWRKRS
jgi:signal transduction histidine kinase